MAAPTATRAAFSDEQVTEFLSLVKGADSVELKASVPELQHRSTIAALGLDLMDAQIRQVFFFDTPDLELESAGVVVRARRIQGKGGDSAVKLRPVVPSELPKALRTSEAFRVEVDALPGGFVCSGTLKGTPASADVKAAVQGDYPVRKLFTKEQRDYFAQHAPGDIRIDDLAILGPIFVLKLRLEPPELGRRLVAEAWFYPDGERILELSTRCGTKEAFQVAAELRAFLTSNGVDLSGEQQTKTRKALQFFADELHKPAAPLAGIVPRWEWRTFGDAVAVVDSYFDGTEPERVQDSDETYLLSLESDASVKVRDGLMDVKLLERVKDGLQQWRPVLKASFPLKRADATVLLGALGVTAPDLADREFELDDIVALSDGLRAVPVHKHREHYLPDGCMVEVSEVRTDGGTVRTVAVESEDPALVLQTVAKLGLAHEANTCLARGLKSLIGFGARYAVLDVGTNSVKFRAAEQRGGGEWKTVVDRAEMTRLGEGLDRDGRLQPQAMQRTLDAIVGMVEEARRDGVAEIAAVGTAGMRIAPNSAELVDSVRRATGVEIEIIPGKEEARLAYVAATSALALGDAELAVFDTGGGSSQFTFGTAGDVDEQFSVDVGAVRLTEEFGLADAVSADKVREARDAISRDFSRLDGRRVDAVVGLGGAVTNLAAVMHELKEYDADVVQGTVLDRAEIERQIELYRTRDADGRRSIVGLQPKRAEVILAGACVVLTVLEKLGAESLTVSDRGLRHGLFAERFSAR
jgi:exopolyphosphatase/guanosine-5'-triphosphate,3'-diphosphate pyrophosphatase